MKFGTGCARSFQTGSQAIASDDFLLRRHDYHVDVAGGFPAAQYVYNITEVDGLRFPTKRRAYLRGSDLKAIHGMLLVSITFDSNKFRLDGSS